MKLDACGLQIKRLDGQELYHQIFLNFIFFYTMSWIKNMYLVKKSIKFTFRIGRFLIFLYIELSF